ncbi:MAG: DMT family transporter [Hyphomonadaceae bacterium]|jgi:drug/metabolite transporter (DMT)-like permease|nr:DMT family transporter [Hyphomonadaceae bacterium]
MQKESSPPAATAGHLEARPLRAIGLMCLAWGLFACLDTTAKYLGSATDLPSAQVVWMRFLGQFLVMIAVLGLIAVPSLLRTHRLKAQIARSFLLLGSTFFNFLALKHLRLDQIATVGFLTPLTVALLAGPMLGEWIGWRRALAILVGFGGILIAIRPGFTDVPPAFLLSFGSMLCYAVFSIVTRYLAAFDKAEVTLFYSLLAGTLIVAPFALADWVWPASSFIWLLLLSLGVYGALGHYLFILAHRHAPASIIAPFLYISLLTHSIAGYLVFGQLPDRWTLAGAAIVIASGLYLLQRERATSRAAAVAMTSEATAQR